MISLFNTPFGTQHKPALKVGSLLLTLQFIAQIPQTMYIIARAASLQQLLSKMRKIYFVGTSIKIGITPETFVFNSAETPSELMLIDIHTSPHIHTQILCITALVWELITELNDAGTVSLVHIFPNVSGLTLGCLELFVLTSAKRNQI